MSDVNLPKLQKLFHEKRYTDVVFEIEALTTEKNRSKRKQTSNISKNQI